MSGEKFLQSAIGQFRKKFILPQNRVSGSNVNQWFPTHMYISMKVMQAKLRAVDCVVEVHDARIPFSGRNEEFRKLLYSIRPHILVLNKCDLIDPKLRPAVECRLREQNRDLTNILWTNCKVRQRESIEKLMRVVNESLENLPRFNRENRTDYSLMVIGIPNVGKSSLVNAIRNICGGLSSAAKVGARPGVTRAVQEKVRIQASPLIYMLDTPGVVAPNIRDVDVGMKMALCETLTELTEPTDDCRKLLFEIALKQKLTQIRRKFAGVDKTVLDLDSAAQFFLGRFRSGKFGCQFQDWEYLDDDRR